MSQTTEARAADWLDRQLTQLNARLDKFLQLRTDQRKALLGSSQSVNWQGKKRENFDSDFKSQHDALVGLKEAAASFQRTVAQTLAETQKPLH
ncbi:hypothetical protein ACWD5R_30355 [Streptomyces sp. NPDC002514]|uniref:hypothetical protein n=1 Tax=unclassified Streptomyces TaxID=2593676 RepID=UPI0036990BE0